MPICALAQATPSPAPPPIAGMVPTTATLAQVLALYKRGADAGVSGPHSEHWTFAQNGLKGSFSEIYDGENFKVDIVDGPFTSSYGSVNSHTWHQNENGNTVPEHKDLHTLDQQSQTALDQAAAGKSTDGISVAGQTADGRAYVLELKPANGRHIWDVIDATTGDILKSVAVYEGQNWTTTFSDFRTVGSVRRAWHVHGGDGTHADNDYDGQELTFVPGLPEDPDALAIPTSRPTVIQFPAGKPIVPIPTQFAIKSVIVRVMINGRGLDFELDSGSSGIVLDTDTAKQLGLKTYGTRSAATVGAYTEHRALVPEMSIGDLKMSNVVVDVLPFNEQADVSTKIVGLLGYDFISGAVLHIDYHNSKVEAIYPDSFDRPAGSATLPVDLDDQVPEVVGGLGTATDSHFIIDTGDDLTMVFGSFARAHPDAVKDTGDMEMTYGVFADSVEGVGGSFSVQPAEVKHFVVGPLQFDAWGLLVGKSPPSFEGDDGAGLIGQDFLAYFDVYLDYPDSTIYLTPNKDFADAFHR
jgi:hypothetical protein